MDDELFLELMGKLRELRELFNGLTSEERWAFLHLAVVMAKGMDKPETKEQ